MTDPGVGLPLGSGIKPGPRIQGGGSDIDHFPSSDNNESSLSFELPGGGPRLSSPGVWTEFTQQTIEKDIQIQECPHDDDFDIQPRVE